MIVSHEHRFIFIRTKKTASTSLAVALAKFCGPDDIITPLGSKYEALRGELGYRRAQNWKVPFYRPSGARKYSIGDWGKLVLMGQPLYFFNHIGATRARRLLGDEIWSGYYKFCFERNPWDKVVSYYYWSVKDRTPAPTLSEFIRSGEANVVGGPGGFDLYTVNQQIVVDRVCRFEDLESEVAGLAERIPLPEAPTLPRVRSEFRTDQRPYRELYDDECRELVAKAFAREIAYFGYTF